MASEHSSQSIDSQTLSFVSEGRVLGVSAFLVLPIAAFAAKGMAALLAVTALSLLVLGVRRHGSPMAVLHRFPKSLVLVLAVFLGFAALSVVWSISPSGTLRSLLGLGLSFLGGLVCVSAACRLDGRDRTFFETALIAGGVFGFALIGFEIFADTAISRFVMVLKGDPVNLDTSYEYLLNPAISVAALYMWPWLLALRRRLGNPVALGGGVAVGWVLLAGESETPLLSLAFGGVVAAAALTLPGKVATLPGAVAKLAAAAIVLAVATAPLLPGALPDPLTQSRQISFLSNSAQHRLVIWRTAADHIASRPLLGHGLNASRALYGEQDRVKLTFATDDPSRTWVNNFEPIPLHPHNGVLQIWLELGAVGAALLAVFLLLLLRTAATGRSERAAWAAGFGLLATGLFMFSLSFGAWQGWWQGTLWLMAAYMAAAVRDRPRPSSATTETGGPSGPEPTRFGDWEKKGRCIDF
ncbi:MAG: DUF1674 domain-containing protein [Alphaproteobacteria bacterium]